MSKNSSAQETKKVWNRSYSFTEQWLSALTNAIVGAVTSTVTAVITAITIILVVLVGLWLAYTYLPLNVFTIIAAVLAADVLFGVVARMYVKSR